MGCLYLPSPSGKGAGSKSAQNSYLDDEGWLATYMACPGDLFAPKVPGWEKKWILPFHPSQLLVSAH